MFTYTIDSKLQQCLAKTALFPNRKGRKPKGQEKEKWNLPWCRLLFGCASPQAGNTVLQFAAEQNEARREDATTRKIAGGFS
jgi:hypothetical protein